MPTTISRTRLGDLDSARYLLSWKISKEDWLKWTQNPDEYVRKDSEKCQAAWNDVVLSVNLSCSNQNDQYSLYFHLDSFPQFARSVDCHLNFSVTTSGDLKHGPLVDDCTFTKDEGIGYQQFGSREDISRAISKSNPQDLITMECDFTIESIEFQTDKILEIDASEIIRSNDLLSQIACAFRQSQSTQFTTIIDRIAQASVRKAVTQMDPIQGLSLTEHLKFTNMEQNDGEEKDEKELEGVDSNLLDTQELEAIVVRGKDLLQSLHKNVEGVFPISHEWDKNFKKTVGAARKVAQKRRENYTTKGNTLREQLRSLSAEIKSAEKLRVKILDKATACQQAVQTITDGLIEYREMIDEINEIGGEEVFQNLNRLVKDQETKSRALETTKKSDKRIEEKLEKLSILSHNFEKKCKSLKLAVEAQCFTWSPEDFGVWLSYIKNGRFEHMQPGLIFAMKENDFGGAQLRELHETGDAMMLGVALMSVSEIRGDRGLVPIFRQEVMQLLAKFKRKSEEKPPEKTSSWWGLT